ncbi:hypothetical protein J2W49_004220 [Hydrogenophaga palleronii]|uniref:DUF916 domain-containing protein n=1 Tax=Hydrogenophaga palleronii TaxID=65655 RepID=A0ABU1WT42_9BURK|nr:hypothetical protein [Hydrogenophaga palleronii]MDR7152244.1 hypothetical protein [Hydrogenophaga palleronii]
MSSRPSRSPEPDGPPVFRRAVRVGWLEAIGVPVLALLPVLALFDQLGPSTARATATSETGPGRVELSVEHPRTVRHRGQTELVVGVHNAGTQVLEGLRIGIDETYLGRFARVDMLPSAQSDASGHVEVALPPLRAGERTTVRMRLEAGSWGGFGGTVQVADAERIVLVGLDISTWVLP